ncbi:MAG: hypothetical protein EA381_18755 [Planctomycetaceae bacterium]|nr:MAG: hypothetical protein EA381_18755 [Planctomycetaceae bacterium]
MSQSVEIIQKKWRGPTLITPSVNRVLILGYAAWAVLAGLTVASAQMAGAYLSDPISAAYQDPYAIHPNGSYGFGGGNANGLIDRPIFDGQLLSSMFAAPRALFGPTDPFRGRMFLRGEYLGWQLDPMDTPPLVTTNPTGTPQNQSGYLGGFQTQTLFGGEVNDEFRSGFRVRGGWYVDASRYWAIGGDYYQLSSGGESFFASSTGSQILARPFYDIVGGRESAQLIGFPARVRGDVGIDATTKLRSFGVNLQADAINPPGHASQIANDCAREPRMDLIIGYRNINLEDQLSIRENLTALVPPGGTVNLRESFLTENQFHGIELGYVREIPFGRWWFETSGRIALGNNSQTVTIAGETQLIEAGVPETFTGGLYAQRTNIGTYERSRFAVVPELGATLGFHVTPRMSIAGGYSFVYISNVVRAGDQIDTDLNPGLIPVEDNPLTGPLRPRFIFRQTDFFAHGVTASVDFRF